MLVSPPPFLLIVPVARLFSVSVPTPTERSPKLKLPVMSISPALSTRALPTTSMWPSCQASVPKLVSVPAPKRL